MAMQGFPIQEHGHTEDVLNNWVFIGSGAYDEYTYVPWQHRSVYRRTVPLTHVVWC